MNKYIITKRYLMMVLAFAVTGLNMPASAFSNTTSTENPTLEQTLPLATDLPDKLNTLVGSLANDADVKYYTFTAVRGQRVLIKPLNYHPSTSPWLIEYKVNDQWKTQYNADAAITPDLTPGQQIQLRISKKPQRHLPERARYEIQFGSAPRLTANNVSGDVDHFNIYFGKYRAYRTFNWEARVVDYKGQPLGGEQVTLELNIDQDSSARHIVSQGISNRSGLVRRTFNLPTCRGKTTTQPFWVWQNGFRTRWQLTYNPGYWFMYPDSNPKGGVGSRDGEKVSFVHICDQTIVR